METELPEGIGSRFGDTSDLPSEILSQIPATRLDVLESQILEVISSRFDGAASVDEILVGLYRQAGVVHERGKLASKLYRMVSRTPKLLESIEGKRGIYRVI